MTEPYCPPAELERPTPRATKARREFTWMQFLAAALLLLFLLMGRCEMGVIKDKKFLKEHGTPTQGTVLKLYTHHTRDSTEYWVNYRYHPPELSMAMNEDNIIDADTYYTLKVGQPVSLLYDKNHPDHGQLVVGDRIFNPWDGVIFVGLVGLFAGMLFWNIRCYRREKYLLQYGKPTTGTLISEKRRSGGYGTRYAKFTYEFRDTMGLLQTGKQRMIPASSMNNADPLQDEFQIIKENTTVLYDPKNSRVNCLYPSPRVKLI